MKKLIATLLSGAAMAFAVAPAAMADEDYKFTVDVSRADTAAGAEAAYKDIRQEAARLCRPLRREWTGRSVYLDCRDEIVDAAVAQIDMPLVSALHAPEPVSRLASRQ